MKPLLGPRARRHALEGSGPIVNRARAALKQVAQQFGAVTGTSRTSVEVSTGDGIPLTLSYDPGNYVFSRVYNLRITTPLPADSAVPAGVSLSHRGGAPRYARKQAGGPVPPGADLRALNSAVGERLSGIDVLKSEISGSKGSKTLSLVPMGGSYVWVLIPPVFKATAFPSGEVERILDLIRALRSWSADPAARSAP